ncbi:GPW/gp25 family protein [Buttiauxella gaviniae]|uniref:GPW/gp25 family protein n=1 Tax=Buttiauxella gaviniae TaxID=82990 RepID=A0ABV3NY95_9ENTR
MPSLLLRLSDNFPQDENEHYQSEEKSTWLLNELKMLFSSRARFAWIENLPLVNASVLNYGINESVSQIHDTDRRKTVIEERIKNTLLRFEPRLTDVVIITKMNESSNIIFEINALHKTLPVNFALVWDDCTGKFYFNE